MNKLSQWLIFIGLLIAIGSIAHAAYQMDIMIDTLGALGESLNKEDVLI